MTTPTYLESCLTFCKYWITYTFHPFFSDPLFRTGTTNTIDGILGILLVLANLIAILRVLDTVRTAVRKKRASIYRRTPVILFLVAALLAVIFIDILRHEHRRLKLAGYAILQTERDGLNWVKGTKKWKEILPSTVDLRKAAYKYAYGSLPGALVDRIPWIPVDWSRNASVWDYFRLLVDDGRRNWWLRQWVMGWVCWSVFVAVECTNRRLGSFTAVCFIFLGYCVSLSGMQFVFYALLLLPTESNKNFWSPKAEAVMGIALSQAGILLTLPSLLNAISSAGHRSQPWLNRLFNMLQLSLIFVPLVIALSTQSGRYFRSLDLARKSLSKAWCVVSVVSALLHVWTSYQAFVEANPGSWLFGRHSRWGGQLSWLVPWRNEYTPPAKDIGHAISAISLTLGDHPWINAVGWDVVFSVAGLCFWSVMSRSDVRDMIKCSIFPWLDDVVEAVEDGLEVADDTARTWTNNVLRAVSPARGAEVLRCGLKKLRSASGLHVEEASDFSESSDEDAQEAGAVRRTLRKLRSASGLHVEKSSDDSESPDEDAQETRRSRKPNTRATRATPRRRPLGRELAVIRSVQNRNASTRTKDPRPEAEEDRNLVTGAEVAAADAEAAAVTLGLYALGGLGMASAAVFGADQIC